MVFCEFAFVSPRVSSSQSVHYGNSKSVVVDG